MSPVAAPGSDAWETDARGVRSGETAPKIGAQAGRAREEQAREGRAQRVLALWSPDWPVTAAAQAAHVPAHVPAAVFLANRVVACSATARAAGVRRGLRRREAQARCPELAVLAPDADRDARLFEPVVCAVEELAPGVEVVRPGLLALSAQGPVGWFGGERAAAERLVDQVAEATGVECQIGFADGLFAAVLAARRGVGVEPGRSAEFLAPLGVEELDRGTHPAQQVDRSELIDLLRRLGLRSLGAFARLPEAEVASRFGADAALCHRLARGLDPRPPVRRTPPEELTVERVLDPPATRVDAAAFAARALADALHRRLAGYGLACTRLGVAARTAEGRELLRIWRCAEPLSPAGTVDRVRWQLDSWLTRGGSGEVVTLRLSPEEMVAAGALQLGLWGQVGEADERAGRALVRVQAILGPEAVLTATLAGGRDPVERVELVPWGERPAPACPEHPLPARSGKVREPAPTWPGRLPAPSPAQVLPEPVPVELRDVAGEPVGLRAADLLAGEPALLFRPGGPPREVREWAGPWPLVQRWWSIGQEPGRQARAWLQVGLDDGTALLLARRLGGVPDAEPGGVPGGVLRAERGRVPRAEPGSAQAEEEAGRWWVTAVYD